MQISTVSIQSALTYLLLFPFMNMGTKTPSKSCVCFGHQSVDPLSVFILALIQLDENISAVHGPLCCSPCSECGDEWPSPKLRHGFEEQDAPCACSSELSFRSSCVCAEQILNILFSGLLNVSQRQRMVVVRAESVTWGWMVDS